MHENDSEKIQKQILLAPFTSIKVGGYSDYFLECKSIEDILSGLEFSETKHLPLHVLGGGSNTLFPDEGFRGLVLKISLAGIKFQKLPDGDYAEVMAGENFDDFAAGCVDRNLSGVECLSGIPGTVGAAPVQNIGAYGQEIQDTIIAIEAMERKTGKIVNFSAGECGFSYRMSRFKKELKDEYIIIKIRFRLLDQGSGKPEIHYRELKELVTDKYGYNYSVKNIRDSVLYLRRKKSMVIDPGDSDSVSCGSFFMNPYVTQDVLENLKTRLESMGESVDRLPIFTVSDRYKLSAAFLIEKAGFSKGYEKNGAGLSSKHALAIVNRGCKRKEILELAHEIQEKVFLEFGIRIEIEPVLVTN